MHYGIECAVAYVLTRTALIYLIAMIWTILTDGTLPCSVSNSHMLPLLRSLHVLAFVSR